MWQHGLRGTGIQGAGSGQDHWRERERGVRPPRISRSRSVANHLMVWLGTTWCVMAAWHARFARVSDAAWEAVEREIVLREKSVPVFE